MSIIKPEVMAFFAERARQANERLLGEKINWGTAPKKKRQVKKSAAKSVDFRCEILKSNRNLRRKIGLVRKFAKEIGLVSVIGTSSAPSDRIAVLLLLHDDVTIRDRRVQS